VRPYSYRAIASSRTPGLQIAVPGSCKDLQPEDQFQSLQKHLRGISISILHGKEAKVLYTAALSGSISSAFAKASHAFSFCSSLSKEWARP
jgi:hypothetical protein